MIKDEEFFKDLFSWHDQEDFPRAMDFVRDAHAGQIRDEGTPYIEHIEGVLKILKDEFHVRADTALSVAALHDVIEDTSVTYEDLKNAFGPVIADAVLTLTKKDGQDTKAYLDNISNSDISWLMIIKLADRLHNLRTIKRTGNPEKIMRKCQETKEYYMSYAKAYPDIERKLMNELRVLCYG